MIYRLRSFLFTTLLFISAVGASTTVAEPHFDFPPLRNSESGLLFTIKGSNTIGAKLAPNWALNYLKAKGLSDINISPGTYENEYKVMGLNQAGVPTYINIHAHGSSTGFKGLNDYSADIAMASRPIKDKENTLFPEIDMRHFEAEHIVAIDGLAIIVHPNNPIEKLSKQQVADIFSGKITSWDQVGGREFPIQIYARDDKSGTWDTFKSLVLGKKTPLSMKAKRFESNDLLSNSVTHDQHGIGFVGLASILDAKVLAISSGANTALKPDSIFVATEDYPLSRRLFMYSIPSRLNKFAQEFLEYVQTPQGQQLVGQVGYVSQKPVSVSIGELFGPDDYIKLVKFGERLSVNFRFNQGSSHLDNKAKRDILRLVNYMNAPENMDKEIQLVGFGDTKSTEQRSLILSKLRAFAVKAELRRYGIHTEKVVGFGSSIPLAARSDSHSNKNRRVEVWVFDPSQIAMREQAAEEASNKLITIRD